MIQDPTTYICPSCEYADRGTESWPCRCCERINKRADYYTPKDGEKAEEPMPVGYAAAADYFSKHINHCGECPATLQCIQKHKDQPDFGGADCIGVIAEWLGGNEK